MVDFRPRRTGVRRVLLILATGTLISVTSMTLGPVISAQRTGGLPALVSPSASRVDRPIVIRDDPGTVPKPATEPPFPARSGRPGIAAIGSAPDEPEGHRATDVNRLALQARLDQLRERYGIPGISVTILFADGTSWVGVGGVTDVATKTPVTPSTGFAIASITKTFTASLILALVEDGRLTLDDEVRYHLPDLEINARITVRQLLDHTSGLRDYFFHPTIDRELLTDPSRRWDSAEAMRYVGKAYFKPGAGWHYSNTNYLVLGLLAEAVGEAPLAEQIRSRFLRPLGLRHTWYQPTETSTTTVAHGYRFTSSARDAKPIDLSDGTALVPFTSVVTAAAGAGGLAASSSDLARWARALYAGDILAASSVEAILEDVARTQRHEPTVAYGLGMQLVDIDGRRSFGHSGRLLGFRSAVRWLPDDDIAIAVLTNQSRTDPGIFVRALLKIVAQGTGTTGPRTSIHPQ